MPIYKYKCKTPLTGGSVNAKLCEHEYEVFYKSFSKVQEEEPNEKCEKCDGTIKERLFDSTGGGFILRGDGWAKDKYGR